MDTECSYYTFEEVFAPSSLIFSHRFVPFPSSGFSTPRSAPSPRSPLETWPRQRRVTHAADPKKEVAMAPTKVAQKLRRLAERKGKAEDQYELGCLLYYGEEGMK